MILATLNSIDSFLTSWCIWLSLRPYECRIRSVQFTIDTIERQLPYLITPSYQLLIIERTVLSSNEGNYNEKPINYLISASVIGPTQWFFVLRMSIRAPICSSRVAWISNYFFTNLILIIKSFRHCSCIIRETYPNPMRFKYQVL